MKRISCGRRFALHDTGARRALNLTRRLALYDSGARRVPDVRRRVALHRPGVRKLVGVAACVAALGAGAVPARAQGAGRLTAEEAVRLGLERNAQLRATRADATAARASYEQVRAGRLPAIRAQGSYTRLSDNIPPVTLTFPGVDSTFTFQAVEFNRYDAELSVEQPIFTGFRLHNEIGAAAQDARAAELTLEQQRADVALQIRRSYWGLYRALAVRDAVEAAIKRVEEHVQDVRNNLRAGSALARDLLAAQTRRSEVLLQRVEAQNAVRVGQLELNRLIGQPLETPVRPAGDIAIDSLARGAVALDSLGNAGAARDSVGRAGIARVGAAGARDSLGGLDPATATPEALVAAALATRPQLAAQEAQVRAARARLRAVQGSRLPELSLVGRYVYARPNPYFFQDQDRFRSTWELGLAARWSIWEGGRKGAQAAEARARLTAAEARFADLREQVAVDVARQQLEVLRAREAVGAAATNVAAAGESYRVARQQFDEGAALSSDVLDAEQAFRQAEANRAGAVADYAIARAALLDALGRVW